jgi:hypothetical protein
VTQECTVYIITPLRGMVIGSIPTSVHRDSRERRKKRERERGIKAMTCQCSFECRPQQTKFG